MLDTGVYQDQRWSISGELYSHHHAHFLAYISQGFVCPGIKLSLFGLDLIQWLCKTLNLVDQCLMVDQCQGASVVYKSQPDHIIWIFSSHFDIKII